LHQGEVFSRQRLQREAAFAALQGQLVLVGREGHGLVAGQALEDVAQLLGAHGGGVAAVITIELCHGADLDLQVAGDQLQLGAVLADEDVGQDGQCVAPLHDAAHRLQGGEDFFLGCFQHNHLNLSNWSS